MNTNPIQQFLSELNRNPRMQQELQALAEDTRGDVSADDVARFAAAHGYEISVREFDDDFDTGSSNDQPGTRLHGNNAL